MALCAFPGGAHEISACLLRFYFWPRPVDEKCGKNEGECNDHCDEDVPKGHAGLRLTDLALGNPILWMTGAAILTYGVSAET